MAGVRPEMCNRLVTGLSIAAGTRFVDPPSKTGTISSTLKIDNYKKYGVVRQICNADGVSGVQCDRLKSATIREQWQSSIRI